MAITIYIPCDSAAIACGAPTTEDLIAAAQQPPGNDAGLRLLATADEWSHAPGAERYLSNAGWQTFCTHLEEVFGLLLAARDRGRELTRRRSCCRRRRPASWISSRPKAVMSIPFSAIAAWRLR